MSFLLRKGPFEQRFGEKLKAEKQGELGKGQFGSVLSAFDKRNNRKVAVKVIKKSNLQTLEDKHFMETEIRLHAELNHPNIATFYEAFSDAKYQFIVLELLEGGELFTRIFLNQKEDNLHYTERTAALVTRNIASALAYMHSKDIVHRDLKPENLLLPSKHDHTNVKVIDFGLAARCTEPLHTPRGTLMYISPEILNQKPYGMEIDIWGLGVVVYSMLCGQPPFYDPDASQNMRNIKSMELDLTTPAFMKISDNAKDLVHELLNRDQHDRITAAEVLTHPWVAHAEETKETEMDDVAQKMRDFKAQQLLLQAIHGVNAIEKMKGLMNALSAESE